MVVPLIRPYSGFISHGGTLHGGRLASHEFECMTNPFKYQTTSRLSACQRQVWFGLPAGGFFEIIRQKTARNTRNEQLIIPFAVRHKFVIYFDIYIHNPGTSSGLLQGFVGNLWQYLGQNQFLTPDAGAAFLGFVSDKF